METDHDGPTANPNTIMAYNCQACVRRKVKCSRTTPKCACCVKYRQECIYQTPPKPRRKKRKGSDTQDGFVAAEEDIQERIARYEGILRKHGLLDEAEGKQVDASIATEKEVRDSELSKTGRFVSAGSKSRYINSAMWFDTGGDELQELSDDSEGGPSLPPLFYAFDPVFDVLPGTSQNLVHFHPSHEHAMKLWRTHVHNIEPLCRILHIPTTTEMLTTVSRNPSTVTRNQECQLFAIYHSAIYSLSDDDCRREFHTARSFLLARYQRALHQALINASWLKTTAFPVMQAYLLFLICAREYLDPHTYWILTGIGLRIAQRMGLHRDPGKTTHLPPFEVQMRRRVFWQLVPLDGFAAQSSGTGITIPPSAWDVRKPLNVDDARIYPGMKEMPPETKGATDMIFVLVRAELSEFYTRKALNWSARGDDDSSHANGPTNSFRSAEESLTMIDEVEAKIEEKFLRYCDIVTANAVRLRHHMQPLFTQGEQRNPINPTEHRFLYDLAQKVLDANNAIYAHPDLKPWLWQVQKFYLWHALMCVLKSITASSQGKLAAYKSSSPLLSRDETDTAWNKMAETVQHHPEIQTSRWAMYASIWKAMVEAWAATPASPGNGWDDEPALFEKLRIAVGGDQANTVSSGSDLRADGVGVGSSTDPSKEFGSDLAFGTWSRPNIGTFEDFDVGLTDWAFWDQLILGSASEQG